MTGGWPNPMTTLRARFPLFAASSKIDQLRNPKAKIFDAVPIGYLARSRARLPCSRGRPPTFVFQFELEKLGVDRILQFDSVSEIFSVGMGARSVSRPKLSADSGSDACLVAPRTLSQFALIGQWGPDDFRAYMKAVSDSTELFEKGEADLRNALSTAIALINGMTGRILCSYGILTLRGRTGQQGVGTAPILEDKGGTNGVRGDFSGVPVPAVTQYGAWMARVFDA
ncbi:hypothetical protein EV401DRAFT_1889452 [Pisolithus croceorrhizus]|nr:hypothetical protein EV401DRAFT_1889452 [Pisolithus croceorrhizus]